MKDQKELAKELQKQSDYLDSVTKRGEITPIIMVDMASDPDRSATTLFLNGKPVSDELQKKLFNKLPDHMKNMIKSGISTRPTLKKPKMAKPIQSWQLP